MTLVTVLQTVVSHVAMGTEPFLLCRATLALLVLVCFVDSEFASKPTEDYPFSLTLSSDNYTVYWKQDEYTVTVEVHVMTGGWVGIGFSPHGGMKVGNKYNLLLLTSINKCTGYCFKSNGLRKVKRHSI